MDADGSQTLVIVDVNNGRNLVVQGPPGTGNPGKVYLQSLPFSRLAGRIYKAAPQTGGRGRGEGSILGGLGGPAVAQRNVKKDCR